jgi:hypothetical protein
MDLRIKIEDFRFSVTLINLTPDPSPSERGAASLKCSYSLPKEGLSASAGVPLSFGEGLGVRTNALGARFYVRRSIATSLPTHNFKKNHKPETLNSEA